MSKEQDVKKDEGLPNIANSNSKPKWIGISVVVIAALIFLFLINSKSKKKVVVDEVETADAPLSFQETVGPSLNLAEIEDNQTSESSSATKALEDKLVQLQALLESNSENEKEARIRASAPTLIIDHKFNQQNIAVKSAIATKSSSTDVNTRFLNNTARAKPVAVQAKKLHGLSDLITEGTIIHATMETAINSDLPGSLRAVINRPVYSADGKQELLSKGDRLVMQYKSEVVQGAARIFAVGTRVITHNGISIDIASAVASNLGVAGIGADSIDTHFWQRFGESSLLAILAAGSSTAGVEPNDEYNSEDKYRQALGENFANAASNSINARRSIGPTLYVEQGREIVVFVAHDLDFSSVEQIS